MKKNSTSIHLTDPEKVSKRNNYGIKSNLIEKLKSSIATVAENNKKRESISILKIKDCCISVYEA